MHKIFGIPHNIGYYNFHHLAFPQKIQNLGSVGVQQGRFLALPNTLRYKMQPFSLKDTSCSGHQRCGHDWWREAALTTETTIAAKLPQELFDLIMSETVDWPMGIPEAAKHETGIRKGTQSCHESSD
ncbi:hypothetical protein N7540_010242 [Penicillium herquei]|nr:hypothetical protein N7540_010242 [Penicillium herquei]